MSLFLQPQTVDRGRDESQVNVIQCISKVIIIIRTYRTCNLITSPESRAFFCFFVFAEASLWLTRYVLAAEDDIADHPVKLCGTVSHKSFFLRPVATMEGLWGNAGNTLSGRDSSNLVPTWFLCIPVMLLSCWHSGQPSHLERCHRARGSLAL